VTVGNNDGGREGAPEVLGTSDGAADAEGSELAVGESVGRSEVLGADDADGEDDGTSVGEVEGRSDGAFLFRLVKVLSVSGEIQNESTRKT